MKHNMGMTRCATTRSSNCTPQEERLTLERTRMAVQSFGLGGRSFLFGNHDDHRNYERKECDHSNTKLYHKTHRFEYRHWHHLLYGEVATRPPCLCNYYFYLITIRTYVRVFKKINLYKIE